MSDWPALHRIVQLEAAIRQHRDHRGDSRCWMDDETLYAVLPEGYTPPARDTAVELANCERFIACRQNPATEYVSPQARIEELEAEVATLQAGIHQAAEHGFGLEAELATEKSLHAAWRARARAVFLKLDEDWHYRDCDVCGANAPGIHGHNEGCELVSLLEE